MYHTLILMAFKIGINYSRHPVPGFKLEKCVEDAYDMAHFLRGTALLLQLA